MLFGAVDVGYPATGGARAALVLASDAALSCIVSRATRLLPHAAPYEPGRFYLRELPAIRVVLDDLDRPPGFLVIDGYVDLDPGGAPGLGRHVHREFALAVIGVAKSPFRKATHALPVTRPGSVRPLYVTAAGLAPAAAADIVAHMHGRHRIPDALRTVDRLSRGMAS